MPTSPKKKQGGTSAPERFARLADWQLDKLRESRVGDAAALIYVILALHADSLTGQCFPGMATIAKLAGKHKGNVKKLLRKLETAELIKIERRASDFGDRDSNLYRLVGVGAPALPP